MKKLDLIWWHMGNMNEILQQTHSVTDYLLGDVKEEELNLLGSVIATPDPIGSASWTWFPPFLF
jgi:hypothetical protein